MGSWKDEGQEGCSASSGSDVVSTRCAVKENLDQQQACVLSEPDRHISGDENNALDLSDLAPEVGEDKAVVKKGTWVVIELKSCNSRLIKISGSGVINLGKFGSFKEANLIGKPLNLTYEVLQTGDLRPVFKKKELDIDWGNPEQELSMDLQNLGKSQNLSYEQIQLLKQESLQGRIHSDDLIRMLIKNSTSFSQKSSFAQQKYIAKKVNKHCKYFTVRSVTARSLCSHFLGRDGDRIKCLTPNAIFQILNQANIHAGGKYLVLDETNGILVAAIYERIGGDGLIFVVSDVDGYQPHVTCYFGHKIEKIRSCIKYIPWFRITPEHDGALLESADPEYISKTEKYIANIKANRLTLESGDFDGLLVVSKRDPVKIVELLSPKITGSGQIVFYSPYKETLIGLYSYMRTSSSYVNVRLFEVCTRKYQVSSDAGGMHSIMKSPGVDNYLLTSTKVLA